MQSAITRNYLILRTCDTYSHKLDPHKPTFNANQVQVSIFRLEYEETQTSILYETIIEEYLVSMNIKGFIGFLRCYSSVQIS